MFSASTEKGPVTPRIVKGWIENLRVHTQHYSRDTVANKGIYGCCESQNVYRTRKNVYNKKSTYRENMTPQSPVLNTTSMVPQLFPVKTYKSLANVMPGKRFVKNTYTALAKIN